MNQLRVRDHCRDTGKYSVEAYSICNLKYKTPEDIVVVFNKGLNYHYKFIIKDVVKKISTALVFRGKYREIYYFFGVEKQ